MKLNRSYQPVPQSRIATFDVYSVGLLRHHISALLEFDVTVSRAKLRELKSRGVKASFNAWVIKAISSALERHPEAAGYLSGKRKLVTFGDVNVSVAVEKEIGGKRVPIPLVISKANEKSITEIAQELEDARGQALTGSDIVINRKPALHERLYYHLPGFLRRAFWRYLQRRPGLAFKTMGNVMVTSLTAAGRINGWFIHRSVHPLSFGVGSIIKKAVVIDDEVRVREILNMTILLDHDVIDGAPMLRFIKDLTKSIENGEGVG